jgi:hypothetical protein
MVGDFWKGSLDGAGGERRGCEVENEEEDDDEAAI